MDFPKINSKQTQSRKRIGKLSSAISSAIDTICEEENHEITYCEINKAIIDVLNSNLGFEMRELWKEKEG